MRAYVASVLECPADKVWDEVQRSRLLLEVLWPLGRMTPVDGPEFPERWLEGATVRCRFYLLGFIPVGPHTIFFERVDPSAREIQSRESDPLVRHWDHLVRIQSNLDGTTHYSDEVLIDAGWLTVFVWLFAQTIYRHRQRRWRRVARRLAAANLEPPAMTDQSRN
jgi:hypothetical protein